MLCHERRGALIDLETQLPIVGADPNASVLDRRDSARLLGVEQPVEYTGSAVEWSERHHR